jgi:hypothetical protein
MSDKLKVTIHRAPDRAIVPVSGCFGAINNNGTLVLHFFLEYPQIPPTATLTTNDSGFVIDDQLDNVSPAKPEREVVVTMAIPVIMAMPICNLIKQQVEQYVESIKKAEAKHEG